MKSMRIVLLAVLAVFMFPSGRVFAHTLKIDGNIGVIVHIDPDDAPVAGDESKIFVEIEDKSGRFNAANPENCDCRLEILQKDVVVKTLSVTTGGRYNQLRFIFGNPGVYTVSVSGKPVGKGLPFQEFRADFEYYVHSGAPGAVNQTVSENVLRSWAPYVVAAVGSAIVLLFVL